MIAMYFILLITLYRCVNNIILLGSQNHVVVDSLFEMEELNDGSALAVFRRGWESFGGLKLSGIEPCKVSELKAETHSRGLSLVIKSISCTVIETLS